MSEQPTHDPAAAFRAEQARRGMTATPEVREWARKALADACRTWTPERFAQFRAYSKRAATDHTRRPGQSPAA